MSVSTAAILCDLADNEPPVSDENNASYVIAPAVGTDSVRELNNHLQGWWDDRDNLTRHLSWSQEQEGPDNRKIYYATAKREPFSHSDNRVLSLSRAVHGHIIGSGSGTSIGSAMQVAASKALEYLSSFHPADPIFSIRDIPTYQDVSVKRCRLGDISMSQY